MSSILPPLFFFGLGSIVASFVGVLVGRLHTGQSFLSDRSRCDSCNTVLYPHTLVPIISYLIARGRARCCSARLSAVSPLTELLLGALFVCSYLTIGLVPALPLFLTALSALLALVLYDLAHQILPFPFLAIFIAASTGSGLLLATSPSAFGFSLITASLIAASLAFIHFSSRGRVMGFADAPLSFGLALLCAPVALSGFVFSFWIGAIVGIFMLAGRPKGSRMGVEVPFAPFLAAGFLLAYFTQWNPFILVLNLVPQ